MAVAKSGNLLNLPTVINHWKESSIYHKRCQDTAFSLYLKMLLLRNSANDADYFHPMLSARRKSDGQTVTAYFESKRNGPFACLECNEEVILKTGRNRVNHFAHANPLACQYATGESEAHRRCKMEIYDGLLRAPASAMLRWSARLESSAPT